MAWVTGRDRGPNNDRGKDDEGRSRTAKRLTAVNGRGEGYFSSTVANFNSIQSFLRRSLDNSPNLDHRNGIANDTGRGGNAPARCTFFVDADGFRDGGDRRGRPFGIPLPWHKVAVVGHRRRQAAAIRPKPRRRRTPKRPVDETTAAFGGTDVPAPATGSVAIDISRISPDGVVMFAGAPGEHLCHRGGERQTRGDPLRRTKMARWVSRPSTRIRRSVDPKLTYEVSRTPPPAAAHRRRAKVAKAATAPPTASAVAGEVMRKFENLVEEAREEAKKSEEAKAEETKKAEGTSRNHASILWRKRSPPWSPMLSSLTSRPTPPSGLKNLNRRDILGHRNSRIVR